MDNRGSKSELSGPLPTAKAGVPQVKGIGSLLCKRATSGCFFRDSYYLGKVRSSHHESGSQEKLSNLGLKIPQQPNLRATAKGQGNLSAS